MHASEQQGQKHCEQLIEHIAKTAGCFFEETYREDTHKSEQLNIESYIELILGLKNNIGGKFSLASSNQDCITVTNSCCPFGDRLPISLNYAEWPPVYLVVSQPETSVMPKLKSKKA